ncbi:MAG: DUF2442 domain-containing protein [Roseburia sp.]|nr:DUF2442 domain-containing protein [Roseburia sp.]
MYNVPKIKRVEPLDGLTIRAVFENGTVKSLDLTGYLQTFDEFKPLENRALFESVKVDAGGFGISWNDRIDLDRRDIWEYGIS